MNKIHRVLILSSLVSIVSYGNYPVSPNNSVTQGSLCQKPDEYRYKERIPYCNRNVSGHTKQQIIQMYDSQFGYRIGSMDRSLFKIDHYVPLCMGGSNEVNNLWPQHQNVYAHTDPLEGRLCELMAVGYMLQRDAIRIMLQAKANPTTSMGILRSLPNPRDPNHYKYFQ